VICRLSATWPAAQPFPEFVVVGSRNGLAEVQSVMAALNNHGPRSFVDALSLRGTARLISDCDFFVGADGGLMHCATAVNLPGAVLFGRVRPNLRLPPETDMQALYDADDVNKIPASAVAAAIQEQWFAVMGLGAAG
jgi:ADP-heptose:LPS heptosyltransferase